MWTPRLKLPGPKGAPVFGNFALLEHVTASQPSPEVIFYSFLPIGDFGFKVSACPAIKYTAYICRCGVVPFSLTPNWGSL